MNFEKLEIIEPILRALKTKGYSEPTPIQAKAIPEVLKRRDVLGCAQTGTGKTAAFSIPIIQIIHNKEGNKGGKPVMRALIVTPTRELAIQIGENIEDYAKHTSIKHTVIFGGVSQGRQVDALRRGVHILVCTPGRLLDLINQRVMSLDTIKLFVLDEADRMLDMGFIHDIKKMLKMLPVERQSLFFSATMPDNIVKLSSTILKDPVQVEVSPVSSTAEKVEQHIYYTNRTSKFSLLLDILDKKNIQQALIFSRTKHGADRIARNLVKKNIKASAIHGDKAQNQRQRALKQFKDGALRVLVATDIAARGIDIDKLEYVINYEIPNMPETYVHRIGRTGRAGEAGLAISISEPEENADVRGIEKLTGKKITIIKDHDFPQTDKPMTDAEKKEWNKEKQRRKQEFFANRKAAKQNKEQKGGRSKQKSRTDKKQNTNKSSDDRNRREDRKGDNANADRKHSRPDSNKSSSFKPKKKSNYKGSKPAKAMPSSLKNKYMWPLEK